MKKTLLTSLLTASVLLASHHGSHEKHDDHSAHGFEPTISLIGDFSYVNRSKALHETYIPGFTHAEEEGSAHAHSHTEPHSKEGFNFNSAELEVEAPIDDLLELRATFHLNEDSFEVEELYGTTHKRDGLNFKAGKFLSSFGANNSKHSETWNFANQPLINNALFGSHGLNEKGIGASWNNKNLTVGLEVLNGTNTLTFGNSEIAYGDGNISIDGSDSPEVNVLYAKYNNRFGTTGFNFGISYAKGKARWDHTDDADAPHALTGDVKLRGADMELTFPITRTSNIKLSAEYIQRKVSNGKEIDKNGDEEAISTNQSGINTQLVYTIDSQWKTGIQYDDILKNEKESSPEDLKRTSFMIERNLSEHNRLRLQYNKDDSKYHDGALDSYSEVVLQWTYAFSTGEHKH